MRTEPWGDVHVDMIGPWPVYAKLLDTDKIEVKVISVYTSIDGAAQWPELIQ